MMTVTSVEETYQKFPELKKGDVQELTEWIRQHPEYPDPDEFEVIRFILTCYYNMDRAKKCAHVYYISKIENYDFFMVRDILLDELKEQMDVVEYAIMPNKDPNGYSIAVHRLKVFEPNRYIFHHSCRLFGMMLDALNKQEGCLKGFIMIFDMNGVSLSHLFRIKLSDLKLFFNYVQEGCPVRLKAVHVVNTLPILSTIMFVVKPFIKKEIFDLLNFHSGNYEEIQKHVPVNCLPSDFGGTLPSIAEFHKEFRKHMMDLRESFLEEDKKMYDFIEKRKLEKQKMDEAKKPFWKWF